jgi:ABC-type methionine transport system ATPase subunit
MSPTAFKSEETLCGRRYVQPSPALPKNFSTDTTRSVAKGIKRFWLFFDTTRATQPLIWEMSRKFDLVFNIRNASVTDTSGVIGIEFQGAGVTIEKAVRWFERKGVHVEPVELNIVEG